MPNRKVFFSFHFDNDVMRYHQIKNIGAIHGDEPVSATEWERIRRGGDSAIERWIDGQMSRADCVIVLIGSETSTRRWVKYEILKAWKDKKPLLGIYIHNINCARNGTCSMGINPFGEIQMTTGRSMADYVECRNPSIWDAYNDIRQNIDSWVESAIRSRRS